MNDMNSPRKISFCIICMNRLEHLRETLLQNIKDNADCPGLEIILLDYNSQDDMEGWAKENLCSYIDSGQVIYYKTFQPRMFNHSHSKNLSFKLADGHIVCNINADVFTGPGFANYINDNCRSHPDIFLYPEPGCKFPPGASGIVCVDKKDFLFVEGFDERMMVYGWEDTDFLNRLEFAGRRRSPIRDTSFFKVIDHAVKYDKTKLFEKVHAIYIDQANPGSAVYTKVLIMFNDHTFKWATIVNNIIRFQEDLDFVRKISPAKYRFQFELLEKVWVEGFWKKDDDCGIELSYNNRMVILKLHMGVNNGKYSLINDKDESLCVCRVVDPDLFDMIVYFEMDYNNRMIMLDNVEGRRIAVNKGVFGQGIVFRNFNYDTSIYVE